MISPATTPCALAGGECRCGRDSSTGLLRGRARWTQAGAFGASSCEGERHGRHSASRSLSHKKAAHLSPEDRVIVAVEEVEETPDILGGPLIAILVKPEVPVAPVKTPLALGGGVAKACDGKPGPVAATVPRRAGLDNCDVSIRDVALHPELVPKVCWYAFTAPSSDA